MLKFIIFRRLWGTSRTFTQFRWTFLQNFCSIRMDILKSIDAFISFYWDLLIWIINFFRHLWGLLQKSRTFSQFMWTFFFIENLHFGTFFPNKFKYEYNHKSFLDVSTVNCGRTFSYRLYIFRSKMDPIVLISDLTVNTKLSSNFKFQISCRLEKRWQVPCFDDGGCSTV